MAERTTSIVILGNSGLVAHHLMERLTAAGFGGHIVCRNEPSLPSGFAWTNTHSLKEGEFPAPAKQLCHWSLAHLVRPGHCGSPGRCITIDHAEFDEHT